MPTTPHVLPRRTFDHVIALPDINWDRISDKKKAQIVDRCIELHQQQHLITEIEGVRKLSGALYLYGQALLKVMDLLGVPISEEEQHDLVIDSFLTA